MALQRWRGDQSLFECSAGVFGAAAGTTGGDANGEDLLGEIGRQREVCGFPRKRGFRCERWRVFDGSCDWWSFDGIDATACEKCEENHC